MAALNPFFNEADEDDSGSAEEESGGLPEPVKVTTGDKQSVINDNDKSEREEDETLELNVNQLEFEELGGTVALHKKATKKSIDNSKDKDEDDVEIIETSNRMNKKTTVEPIIHPESRTSSDPLYTAKLIQLNKSGSYVTKGKVKSGTVEVLDGEYTGKKAFFQVGCCYVWGYHMANANLMYNLRSGDKFQVSITVKEGVAVDDVEVPLLVKKAWLGIQSEKPVLSADDLEFATWLIERNLSEEEFLQWISDKLPPKPFFPLKTEVYEAKVIMLIRENPKGDGALVRIVKEGDMRDNLAVFERDDFYLCGVHVGEADMRFLIRPGDTCSIQIRELSEREKKARCKKYPKLEEFEFNYTCLLAYTGEIRPRGPNMRPAESQELRMFLEQKGMSIQEFEEMRNISDDNIDLECPDQSDDTEPPGTGVTRLPAPVTAAAYPAVSLPPASLPAAATTPINSNMSWLLQSQASGGMVTQFPQPNPAGVAFPGIPAMFPQPSPALTQTKAPTSEQVEKIARCNTLVARAVLIGSGQRKNISELLKTDEDFELGYFLADILTSALVSGVQNKVKSKVFEKMGTGASAALDSQSRQLDMVRAQLLPALAKPRPLKADIIQAATNVALAANKPASQAMVEAQQKTLASLPPVTISQVELYDKQQQEARTDFGPNKGLQSMSDMKKRLEAFKAAKKVSKSLHAKISKKAEESIPEDIEVNKRSSRWDNTETMEEQSMKPLDLIRKYVRMKKNIELRDGKVYFGELSFVSDMKTNLTISRGPGELPDYYTMGCLAFFIRNIKDDHPEYVRKCICDKIQCVRRVDRDNIMAYITGEKDFVLNLDSGVSPEYGGSTASQHPTRSESRDIVNVDMRKRSRSRSKSRDRGKRRRSRSRSRSRDRRRSPRSRDRGRWSRSRSRDRNLERSRASRERGGREMGYNPDNPTSSPNQALQESQRPTFAQFGDNTKSGSNSFDQRPSFDQRGGNGFDQRPSDTCFNQRAIGYPVGFGKKDLGGGGFDQRISEGFDQRSLNPQSFSGFDQRSQNMNSFEFDQRENSRSHFSQFQSNNDSRFKERSSQEMNSRSSWGNEISQIERSQMNLETDFSEYDAPRESQHQWRGSMDKISNQRQNFGQDQSGRHRSFVSSDFEEYGGGDMRQQFMDSERDDISLRVNQRSINNDVEVRDTDVGDTATAADDNRASNLGPMFVIGQNNSSKSSAPAPRRW